MPNPLPPSIRDIVEAIHRDHESGAVSLARQAAEAFRKLANGAEIAAANLRVQAETLGQLLIKAQPSMAPLRVLSGRCQSACAATSPSAARALTQTVDDFLAQLTVSAERIGTSALELIPDRATVLTISASATVLHALLAARQAGRDFRVVCTESRPQNEGVGFARAVAASGIPVTLILDAALADVVPGAIIMVGADACTPAGIINKVGTHTLAVLAGLHRSPCYALLGQEKMLPKEWATDLTIADQAAEEILPNPVPGVTVINRYFEVTPLHRFTGLVTDLGFLTPDDALHRLEAMAVNDPLV